MPHDCAGAFPGNEGGIQVLAGLAPSSQRVGSLLRTRCRKKDSFKLFFQDAFRIYFCQKPFGRVTFLQLAFYLHTMEQHPLKNVCNCLNTNIYSYLEISGVKIQIYI
jgi:hypothetical protein